MLLSSALLVLLLAGRETKYDMKLRPRVLLTATSEFRRDTDITQQCNTRYLPVTLTNDC